MKFVFDWHSQDSRAAGPLEVANTVTAQYGTGGKYPDCGTGNACVAQATIRTRRWPESLQCADYCGGG